MTVWRAYYVFDSSEFDWADLPDDGILGVVIDLPGAYKQVVQGGDYFYLDDDGVPACTDTHPEFGRYIDPPDRPNVKEGEAVPDDEWAAIKDVMVNTDL